ncbi:MAG: DUF58 domain-containing protein [Clostridium sp.]|uniref:DUF58 domain-containing protein n=1 Tax=Clostridium sp. TaxID=1506 RepID=UPI0025B7D797|nr:DUF58 domain-containing protein [Clostridium sp.]MCF0148194.1 DUF58 domain-containing protein [Clostridium sp.]
MRKIIYFIFLIVTFYLAGTHKLRTLILLVCSVLILFIILFLTTKYFQKNIYADIEVNSRVVKKGNTIKGNIVVINESSLPITRFTIKIEYFNNRVTKSAVKVIKGYVPAKSTTSMEFQMKSKYCGILDLKVKEIKVYDYFLLFKRKKKIQSHKEILILPSGYQLKNEIQSNSYIYFPLEDGRYSEVLMNQPPEILWIDKYKHGDSIRDIHWKLSARNDEVLSKKYSSDIENRITLFIDLRTEKDISIERKDVFYELCSAISLGLIENKVSHLVKWYDIKNMSIVEELVRTEEDYVDMIEKLMLKAELFNKKSDDKLLNGGYLYEDPFETVIALNLEFKVFLNKDLLMKFSEENYLEEIERRCLTV